MRSYTLNDAARTSLRALEPAPARRVIAIIVEMLDEDVPLVRETDFVVTRGPQIMARPVPGTDLAIHYVPAGVHVFVVDVVRHPPA